jgi:hypothetical protein
MSAHQPRFCIDRVLKKDLVLMASPELTMHAEMPVRMAVETAKAWEPGTELKVVFLDGHPEVQARVEEVASQWPQHANLSLDFGNHPEADIRISFELPGSWSYLGLDAHSIAPDRPTMNYGWLEPGLADADYLRVVLHEFGHALGAIHEHQNPAVGIPWDREAVYAHYAGPPNLWDKDTVDVNIFQKYSADRTQHTEFDPHSIMLYPVPNELTVGEFEVGWNSSLSDLDREFIGVLYPAEPPDPSRLPTDGTRVAGDIGAHGEEDTYWFQVTERGRYVVETHGDADVVMALFGPDDPRERIARDDDSGRDRNAEIDMPLEPGRYQLRVWHYWPRKTGSYEISVGRS